MMANQWNSVPPQSVAPELFQAVELYRAGRLDDARRSLTAHLQCNQQDVVAVELLGRIEIAEGAVDVGLARLESLGDSVSRTADECIRFGRLRFDQRRPDQASGWLRKAVQLDPGRADGHYWFGNALRLLGEYGDAEFALRNSIRLAPGDSRGYVALAFLYRTTNRYVEAAATLLKLVDACSTDDSVVERVVGFLEDIDRHDLAETVASTLERVKTEDPRFMARLGRLRERVGRFSAARDAYRRSLVLDPANAVATQGLASIRRFESMDDSDVGLIRAALEVPLASADSRASALFALGKIHDDIGEFEPAFQHYQQGNRLRAARIAFDVDGFRHSATEIRSVFTRDTFARMQPPKPRLPTPIFIVGMLRSGTSLTESILGSHPEIHPAGELPDIGELAASVGGSLDPPRPYPQWVVELPPSALQSVTDAYHGRLAAHGGTHRFATDKNPLNFLHLGLIARLIPRSRIVHCTRHPLDVCLSIYFQNFAHPDSAYSFDLNATAEVYIEYAETMRHWRRHLPIEIFDVAYEDLVTAPERETRRLLEFLGLPFDDQCLHARQHRASIRTASAWQARQSIHGGSIGRWRHYAEHLQSLADRLRAAGVAIDES